MLSTVLLPTEGQIFIDGKKLDRKASVEKSKLSVITQEYSMRQDMTMDEVMEYQGRLYYLPKKVIKQKSAELLEFAGLSEYRHLLLDEPTAGMDAISRRQMWNLLRQLHGEGITILLTTHYIEEAQSLCERIALINKGSLNTIDTPANLIEELGQYTVDETAEETLHSTHFHSKEEAIEYLRGSDKEASMRNTTLEDVFIYRIGRGLGSK